MKISFACPSCGVSGSADDSLAGKLVRCKPCNHRFAIPKAGESEAGGYGLDAPASPKAGGVAIGPDEGSVFAPSRGDSPVFAPSPGKRKATPSSRPRREERPDFDRRKWLIRGGAAVVLGLVGIALLAPNGLVVAGSAMMILGASMILVGYGAGLYGAFSEDFLYFLLYLLIPLYAAYYLVTRWEDLWAWFACSTAGFALVLLGTQMLRWGGVEA